MWKAPNKPGHEITQGYGDGVVTVYAVQNIAAPGLRPQEGLIKKITLRYEEQRLGIQRYYSGRQNQVEIQRVLRVPRAGDVSTQDVAITQDGKQYRIDLVQAVTDVYPASVDLTLAKIEQQYEVPHEVV